MTSLNPDAGLSVDEAGNFEPMPKLIVTPIEGGDDFHLNLYHSVADEGFVAYWVYGLPGERMEMLDLKHLPDGMEIRVVMYRHGWTAPSVTHYGPGGVANIENDGSAAVAVPVATPASDTKPSMPVEDVLALMEVLVGDKSDLEGLALPAPVVDRLEKAVSDGVIEVAKAE